MGKEARMKNQLARMALSLILPSLLFCAQVFAQAAKRETVTAAQWLQRERVRCLAYVDVSDKAEESIRRTKELGFNCVLSGYPDLPVTQLMPLVEAGDRHGIRIIWVNSMMDQFGNPALRSAFADDSRRFVGKDGRLSTQSACQSDPVYWKAVMLDRALALAKLSGEGHTSSAGLLLDLEDYNGLGDWDQHCYCERDFEGFLRSIDRLDVKNISPHERYGWIKKHGFLSRYEEYQDSVVTDIFSSIRAQIDKVYPDFLFAIYPWFRTEPDAQTRLSKSSVEWDVRLAAGLGTRRAPFLFFIEGTYDWGYDPFVESASAQLREKGLHFRAVSGFNVFPAIRVWWPDQMAPHAYYASVRSGGYWVFCGHLTLLLRKGEQLTPQIGGTPDEWVREFKNINGVIAKALSGSQKDLHLPLIPMSPLSVKAPTFIPSDLFSYQCSAGSAVMNRQWTRIGLPWEGGEVALLAGKAGEWFSFERDIPLTDRYQISGWLTRGPDRGEVQLCFDGKPAGEPVDLYAPTVTPRSLRLLGRAMLKQGRTRLELRTTGKNPRSAGYAVGLSALVIEQIGQWPEEWNVILPFDNTGEGQPGYHTVYPPEREIRLDTTYLGKNDAPLRWQTVRPDRNGYLDLRALVSDIRNNVAYASVFVHCPTPGYRKMFLGTDDGGKLWINGTFVWGENVARGASRNGNSPVAYFNAGWNRVLMKVTQVGRGWGMYFRVFDPENSLRYSAELKEQEVKQ